MWIHAPVLMIYVYRIDIEELLIDSDRSFKQKN